jgi:hypothetical protein
MTVIFPLPGAKFLCCTRKNDTEGETILQLNLLAKTRMSRIRDIFAKKKKKKKNTYDS